MRQFNDYGSPCATASVIAYGLAMANENGVNGEYNNRYTSKELQTDEFVTGQGLEMYDFNARYYDPQLGRWFAPDPAMQFANPYLAMGNNPVMYVDPDGEIAFLAVVGIFAAVQLGSDLIRNDGKMNIGEIGMSVGLGALQGALAFAGPAGLGAYAGCGAGWLALGSAVAGQINIPVYQGDNFSLSVSPSLNAGTNGVRLGANVIGGISSGNTSISFGYSLGRNFSATDLSGNLAEARWSSNFSGNFGVQGDDWSASVGATAFGGNYAQTVGNYGFSKGRFGVSLQNDFGFAGDGSDRYRTAALGFSYQVNDDLALSAGFSLWTGEGGTPVPHDQGRAGLVYPEGTPLRNGNLFVGANYRGNSYRIGANGEGIRSAIQNNWHDAMGSRALKWAFGEASPHFRRMEYDSRLYTNFGTYDPFSLY